VPSSKLKPAKQQVVWLFKSVMPKELVVPLTAPFDTLLVCVGVYIESRGPEAKFTNKQFFLIRNLMYVVAPQQLRSVHLFYFVLFRNKFRAHSLPILFSVIWIRWQASRI
jgi:hypothetical protein